MYAGVLQRRKAEKMIVEVVTAAEALVLWAIVIRAFLEIRKKSMLLLGMGVFCFIIIETSEHLRGGFRFCIRPLWEEVFLLLGYGLILASIFMARKEIGDHVTTQG
jgi:hypothetical protein